MVGVANFSARDVTCDEGGDFDKPGAPRVRAARKELK